VDCRHVGRGKSALLYLSKYLYRGVLVVSLLSSFNATFWRISPEIILGYLRIMVQFLLLRNISLYKVTRACSTLRIGVGFVTHILICYVHLANTEVFLDPADLFLGS
jgi:hypothetical protein